jgi:hypothetical protein
MASGDRDGDGFIQVSELAADVQDRVPGQQRVTNDCRTHQNRRLILGPFELPKPEVCGLATPASLIAHPCPRPHQTGPNTRVACCQVLRERAVFHRSDGNIITHLA